MSPVIGAFLFWVLGNDLVHARCICGSNLVRVWFVYGSYLVRVWFEPGSYQPIQSTIFFP